MFPTAILNHIIPQPFKRAQLGLFHGAMKQYGNNVPHSKHKTRRTWLPNIQTKRLYSRTLDQWIKLSLTTRALRCIDKVGGLDEYILKTRAELLGWEGMRLRVQLRDFMQQKAALQQKTSASAPRPRKPKTSTPSTHGPESSTPVTSTLASPAA